MFSNIANLESIFDCIAANCAEINLNKIEFSCAEESGTDTVGGAEVPCLCHSIGVDVEEGTEGWSF